MERAVKAVLKQGIRTVDIAQDGMAAVGCKEMARSIAAQIG